MSLKISIVCINGSFDFNVILCAISYLYNIILFLCLNYFYYTYKRIFVLCINRFRLYKPEVDYFQGDFSLNDDQALTRINTTHIIPDVFFSFVRILSKWGQIILFSICVSPFPFLHTLQTRP